MLSLHYLLSAIVLVTLASASTSGPLAASQHLEERHQWRHHRYNKSMSRAQWRKMKYRFRHHKAYGAGKGKWGGQDCDDDDEQQQQSPQPIQQTPDSDSQAGGAEDDCPEDDDASAGSGSDYNSGSGSGSGPANGSEPAPPQSEPVQQTRTSSAPAAPAPTPVDDNTDTETPAGSNVSGSDADVLKAHNDYRAKHGAKPLVWDSKLAAEAQKWTDRCVYEHGGGKSTGSGENIAKGHKTIVDAFNAWGPGEEDEYNPANPKYSHFTQVVWKATTKLGCGTTVCDGSPFYSCIYNPAGNMYGPGGSTKYFDENVQK